MYCPACAEVQLVMAERQGIEIDYCPQCRGVWLDRGELDKLIERAAPLLQPQGFQSDHTRRAYDDDDDDYRRRKRRGGFFGELFDFD